MIFRAVPDRSLDEILSGVSRSFYLSLAVLPRAMRAQLSAAYLVARAADTIADTEAVQAERRLELLGELRAAIEDPTRAESLVATVRREVASPSAEVGSAPPSDAERVLLGRLGDCLRRVAAFEPGDRDRARKVLGTLVTGMERDLARFGEGRLTALETLADLDEYCYLAAGCVGEYWTVMTAAHVPGCSRLSRPDLVARGVRLGKALQMVNVLRDAASDLRQGRCFLPRELLGEAGMTPEVLRTPGARVRARPVFDRLTRVALAHIDAAFPYVMAIPRSQPRLRLAALWPLWIGLGTIERIAQADDPLDPEHPLKISRREVYGLMAESAVAVGSGRALRRLHDRRRTRVA